MHTQIISACETGDEGHKQAVVVESNGMAYSI